MEEVNINTRELNLKFFGSKMRNENHAQVVCLCRESCYCALFIHWMFLLSYILT